MAAVAAITAAVVTVIMDTRGNMVYKVLTSYILSSSRNVSGWRMTISLSFWSERHRRSLLWSADENSVMDLEILGAS